MTAFFDPYRPQARPTTYKGIAMRSRLEARFAAYLDAPWQLPGLRWQYEPRAFGSERGQYLPDFQVWSPDDPLGAPYYLEVKPTLAQATEIRDRMAIIWDSAPDAVLCIYAHDEGLLLCALGESRRWFVMPHGQIP